MPLFEANKSSAHFVSDAFGGSPIDVKAYRSHEAINQLGHHDVVLALAPNFVDELPSLLGGPGMLSLDAWSGGQDIDVREVHGVISKVWARSDGENDGVWVVTLVPRLWLLTQERHSRIFQEMSVQDIIQDICDRSGVEVEFKLNGSRAVEPRVMVAQYDETDFNFVSRLAEDTGLLFFVDHASGADIVVFVDTVDKFEPTEPLTDVPWEKTMGSSEASPEQVYRLDAEVRVQPTSVRVDDYNYEEAGTALEESMDIDGGISGSVSLLPGGFRDAGDAQSTAEIRAEEFSGEVLVYNGMSTCRSLTPGRTIQITTSMASDDPPFAVDKDPLALLEVRSDFDKGHLDCEFAAVSSAVAYRSPRVTHRPRIYGAQTAIVVGHDGDGVMTEELGRVRVEFRWDENAADAPAGEKSCWVRVAQTYAGVDHGSYVIPRVGDEVVVVFEYGDPDRPLIVGSVYNSDFARPLDLPSQDHYSNFRTPAGLVSYINDKDGEHEVHFSTPSGLHVINVQAGKTVSMTAEDAVSATGESTMDVKAAKDITVSTDANLTTSASSNHSSSAGADVSIDAGGNVKVSAGTNVDVSGGADVNVDGGANVNVVGGAKVKVEGAAEVLVQSGGGSLKIDAAGNITMMGTMITIQASGNLTLMGAMVKVN